MGVRKKICPKCGRKLWPRDFYKNRTTGQISSTYCKDCMRVIRREEYRRNRKKPAA